MSAIGSALIGMIKWYQRAISAKTPPCCKYYPSCSHYAITAVR
ncbi:membrane protein insertion efficiency factor YidD, partial [Escherichia coli]|nr:membrane protein insertion efficiency factor YidD [Escherichia coli]